MARIDADDWWMPNKLEKQIDFMEKNKSYGIIGCFYRNIYKGKERPIKLPISNEEIKKTIIKKNPFAHSCVLFKTDLIKKAGGYNENLKYAQDYELWLRLFPLTKFYNIPEFLCYRSIEKGISKENQKDQMKLVLKTKIKYIRKYNLSPKHYIYLFDILSLILIPDTIKNLKRKLL